jgi:hypothetical protein
MVCQSRKGATRWFLIGIVVSALVGACMGDSEPAATATTPPEPVTESYQEPCNNIWVVPELGGNTVVYAEHRLPGSLLTG